MGCCAGDVAAGLSGTFRGASVPVAEWDVVVGGEECGFGAWSGCGFGVVVGAGGSLRAIPFGRRNTPLIAPIVPVPCAGARPATASV
ncbi:MAG TPA: hypothetical protein VK455_08270, partial [Thermoplasmata archaeon]|nr:hypothetical protein [Thermoplasmata archaeon]